PSLASAPPFGLSLVALSFVALSWHGSKKKKTRSPKSTQTTSNYVRICRLLPNQKFLRCEYRMAYFQRTGENEFTATEHAGGAWNPKEQHIAPMVGLMTHLTELDHAQRDAANIMVPG